MLENTNQISKTASAKAKPFIKWVGGKSQLVDEIKILISSQGGGKCKKYAEPMIGGGAIFFNIASLPNFNEFYISDINPKLINTYSVIQHNVEDLITELQKLSVAFLSKSTDEQKTFYYSIRDSFNNIELAENTSVNKASEFIFLNRTCFNGLYRENRNGKFNVPMGKYKNPLICDSENLERVSKLLQNVVIKCGDYSLSNTFIDKDTLVYFDPPYRPISKTANFTSYNATFFNDNEQNRLFEFVNEIHKKGANFILSNSDPKNTNSADNFFDDLYKDYNIKRVLASRMINSKSDKRGQISELLIYN